MNILLEREPNTRKDYIGDSAVKDTMAGAQPRLKIPVHLIEAHLMNTSKYAKHHPRYDKYMMAKQRELEKRENACT